MGLPITIEALTPIWQRVLQRTSIGPDDDFFELGGNASLAARLFTEVAQEFGQTLPPATICAAPTIAALAARLETPQPRSPLVLLKAGAQRPPVFMTHGIGGSVIDLVLLARQMQLRQPVYGMEARGNDGVEAPFDRIEDMAQFFLDSLRQVQPRGPYFLIGYSLGGLVTLEMSQRLVQEGERMGLLVMLDSYPERHTLPLGQHARLILQLVGKRMAEALVGGRPDRRSDAGANLGERSSDTQPDPASVRLTERVKDAQNRAWRNYRPRFYDGRVQFVRAEISSYFPNSAAAIWERLVTKLEVETAPGDHVGMLTTHRERLASLLSRYLGEVTGSPA